MKYIKKFKLFTESVYVGLDGSINYPEYLIADENDNLNDAFDKGQESFDNDCDISENPYIDVHEDMVTAWNDGFRHAERNKTIQRYNLF